MDNEELRVEALKMAHALRPDVITPEPKLALAERIYRWFRTGELPPETDAR